MNCPKCNHDVKKHLDTCYETIDILRPHGEDYQDCCQCNLSEGEALSAAQRAAAIAHLRFLGKSVLFWLPKMRESPDNRSYRKIYFDAVSEVNHAIAAYRAVGILRERKP